MSFVSDLRVVPEALTTAAGALQSIGDHMVAEGVAADQETDAVVGAGGDDVSAQFASRLREQAADFRRVGGRAAVIFGEFVAALSESADAYSTAEDDNVTLTG